MARQEKTVRFGVIWPTQFTSKGQRVAISFDNSPNPEYDDGSGRLEALGVFNGHDVTLYLDTRVVGEKGVGSMVLDKKTFDEVMAVMKRSQKNG